MSYEVRLTSSCVNSSRKWRRPTVGCQPAIGRPGPRAAPGRGARPVRAAIPELEGSRDRAPGKVRDPEIHNHAAGRAEEARLTGMRVPGRGGQADGDARTGPGRPG